MTAANLTITSALGAAAWLGLLSSPAAAQTPAPPDLTELKAQAQALEKRLPVPALTPKASFDLSPARQERFQKFLPKAFRKLSQRESVHLLVLGDATAFQIQEGPVTDSFPGVFATHLANQFFYTGGVQESGKVTALDIPTLTLRTLARPDGSVMDAAAILESTGRQTPVDIVLICYGQADAALQPPVFSRAISAALASARLLGADVILCSPWLPVAEQSEAVMGLGRPLADVLQETAEDLGVLQVDLGDLSRLLSVSAPATQDEGQVFERLERTYREFFSQAEDGSFVPRGSLHRQLGAMIYKELLDAPPGPPWQISTASASQTEAGKLTLRYTLKNTGAKTLDLTALPLIASGWKPVEARSALNLKPGASQNLSVTYATEGEGPPLQEPFLRLPVLVTTDGVARVETLRAAVEPVTIVWGLETLFNQEAEFLGSCQLVNPGKSTVKGTWKADFAGKALDGSFELPPEGTAPLNLHFDLPKDGPAMAALPLKLTVVAGDKTWVSTRQVTLTKNLGLGQAIPLAATATTSATKASSSSPATLTAKATAKSFTLAFDLPDVLQDSPTGAGPAWQVELNLDARSYGKRLEPGSTATLRATGNAADGPGKVHPVPAWAFGTGYAATYDPKAISAVLATTGGKRQIVLTLPRSYLYLHEWALDNGNSQLGLNVRLTLNGPEGYLTHRLPLTSKPVSDIEALVVLELSTKPTARTTICVE